MYIICKRYPNTSAAILCCANCLCRKSYENIRNETICKITKSKFTKHDLMQIKMAYNLCIFFILLHLRARARGTGSKREHTGTNWTRGEVERETPRESETTRKTVCAQRACIRRMKRARNGRKGACYTSTCISSSTSHVCVYACVCLCRYVCSERTSGRRRDGVKYAFRQLILTHNFIQVECTAERESMGW